METTDMPIHNKDGWELVKYEWLPDGRASFEYERDGVRRCGFRTQPKYVMRGGQ